MDALAFRCPQTSQTVATGISIDRDGVGQIRSMPLRSRCPYCAELHELRIRDAFFIPMMRVSEGPRRPERPIVHHRRI
jgi:hypothetical protein